MSTLVRQPVSLGVTLLLAGLIACGGGVEEEVFNEEIADMRSELDTHEQQLGELEQSVDDVRSTTEETRSEIQRLEEDFQARITELEEGLRFAMPIHFDFDEAEIRSVDQPVLDRFASVVQDHYANALITVEGFADPAGSNAYNMRLSEERAQAAASYLTEQAGLDNEVRAVGYGQDRQVRPGEFGPGEEGVENRRVAFVVDFAGTTSGTDGAGEPAEFGQDGERDGPRSAEDESQGGEGSL